MSLVAPFPYYGGKSTVAGVVWAALGDPVHYVEPFFGSGAVLLGRPVSARHRPREVVNDLDGHVVNFWRSIAWHPDRVSVAADWPVTELDLHARNDRLAAVKDELRERLRSDPSACDPELAGWWVWAMAALLMPKEAGTVSRSRPRVNRRQGVVSHGVEFGPLAERLRDVAVLCGDWSRTLSDGAVGYTNTMGDAPIGVFLDPPYEPEERTKGLYPTESGSVAGEVLEWCRANGDRERWRIVLAGFDSEHAILEREGWRVHGWASGHPSANRTRERLWFSPHCLDPNPPQSALF